MTVSEKEALHPRTKVAPKGITPDERSMLVVECHGFHLEDYSSKNNTSLALIVLIWVRRGGRGEQCVAKSQRDGSQQKSAVTQGARRKQRYPNFPSQALFWEVHEAQS